MKAANINGVMIPVFCLDWIDSIEEVGLQLRLGMRPVSLRVGMSWPWLLR
jgi:hypothetical protein